MNKSLYFGLGTLIGAAGGSLVTYFLVKDKIQAEADEEIEAYAEHCEERINRIKERFDSDEKEEEKDEEVKKELDPEEEKINSNEGVKKYHYYDGISSKYGDNHIFGVDQSEKERSEIKQQINETVNKKRSSKLIDEITEEEFLNEDDGYDKASIDVLLGDDKDIVGFWGYKTDNEEFVEKKFGVTLEEIIGEDNYDYDLLMSNVDKDEDVGSLYLRNSDLMTDFEVIIRDMREDDK